MTHYLRSADGTVWLWTDQPYPGRLEQVPELPPGERITGRLIDHGACLEIRLDSKPKMPLEVL